MLFDHVTIRVPGRGEAERLFETVLAPLGIDTSYRTKEFTEWQEFMVAQATDAQPATRGLHVAFVAPSREQVDAFWQAGIDAGYGDDGPPGPRPQYRRDYYGGFLRDPSATASRRSTTRSLAIAIGSSTTSGFGSRIWRRRAASTSSSASRRGSGC
ncbi:MAG: VOC family protein [Solirubrobacteraceae bacterium]